MESFVDDEGGEERTFLVSLVWKCLPRRLLGLLYGLDSRKIAQLIMLVILTAVVGTGYLYGRVKY
jgi:hypothetical protein